MAHEPDQNPGGEDPKLASLEARLEAARRAEADRTATPNAPMMGMTSPGARQGQRVLSILIGYPAGGGIIGWFLDGAFGTRPWIMLVLLFLAFAAACFQVFRVSKERPE